MIGDERFCHGDDERPSCYEKQNWDRAQEGLDRWLKDVMHTDNSTRPMRGRVRHPHRGDKHE